MYCGRCRAIRHRFDFDREPVDKIKYVEDKILIIHTYDYFLLANIMQFVTETFNNFMKCIFWLL